MNYTTDEYSALLSLMIAYLDQESASVNEKLISGITPDELALVEKYYTVNSKEVESKLADFGSVLKLDEAVKAGLVNESKEVKLKALAVGYKMALQNDGVVDSLEAGVLTKFSVPFGLSADEIIAHAASI
ncbi:MAG: hypothetical protein OCD01_13590 [Fibrobacterales bacterium]